jgi:riboflavin biosynthesis pyrimidine reductase
MSCGFPQRCKRQWRPSLWHMDLEQLTEAYASDDRGHADGAPWLMVNMIASLDGAIEVDGLSGGLGNHADLAVFKTLRAIADVVLVGAGTAAAEEYKIPTPSETTLATRRARGQQRRPIVALVTRSLRLDLAGALFADPSYRPVVVTTTDADPERLAAVEAVADVVRAGTGNVDLGGALGQLAERVGPMVLGEGGPTLNGQLIAEDLVDELCLTVSPVLVGGTGGRLVAHGDNHAARPMTVTRAATVEGLVFTRSVRG